MSTVPWCFSYVNTMVLEMQFVPRECHGKYKYGNQSDEGIWYIPKNIKETVLF